MRKRNWHPGIVLLLAGLAGGCSSALRVQRVTFEKDPPKDIPGLAVNQPILHDLIAVFPATPGSDALVRRRSRAMLPAKNELYVVGFRGALFRSNSLDVTLHPDSSLQKVSINSDSQAAAALEDLSKAAETAGSMKQQIAASRKKPETDAVAAENDSLRKELLNLMLKANKDAAAKGQPLPYPDLSKF